MQYATNSTSARSLLLALAAVSTSLFVGSSCTLDPVHDGEVKALGPEPDPTLAGTEYHRSGQPCVTCHGPQGPANTQFALAGTIYWGSADSDPPTDVAYVRVLDAKDTSKCFVTNCMGNFFVPINNWPDLTYPLLISVQKDAQYQPMNSHVGREPSCANCHEQPAFYNSPGQVYLYKTGLPPIPAETCPPQPDGAGNLPPPPVCPENVGQ